jgi:GntR family transcriptional regulator
MSTAPPFLYKQLLQNIEERVRRGELKAGDLVPSEAKLQEEFNMSRVTVRKALLELEQRGLVTRMHGKGTYISNTTVAQALGVEAHTIVETFQVAGVDLEVTVLALTHIEPPEAIASLFDVPDQQLVCLSRVYSSEGEPIGVVHLYLPLALSGVAYILRDSKNPKETSYSVFEERLGLSIGMVKHEINAVPVCAASATALGLAEGHICLTMDRTTCSTQGAVIEFARFIYAPGCASFEIELPRHAPGTSMKISSPARAADSSA